MALIKSFRDLNVYKAARREAKEIFEISRSFPKHEQYSLTDQIRSSSRAVCALLAEAWGRRRYVAAFANKVSEALGEAHETQAWLDHALDCEYISSDAFEGLDAQWQKIGGMLNNTIDRADTFCSPGKSKD